MAEEKTFSFGNWRIRIRIDLWKSSLITGR